MSNIEKIKAEIKRLKNIAENDNASEYLRGQARVCRVILSFIDSLPEEKPSEDLENTAHHIAIETLNDTKFMTTTMGYVLGKLQDIFIAGAEWMRNNLPERIKK